LIFPVTTPVTAPSQVLAVRDRYVSGDSVADVTDVNGGIGR
jgi:hypothetical protein